METVSIAHCFNNNYCKMAAATIASEIRHFSESFHYDIYIVHNDITEENQYLLGRLNTRGNVSLKFVAFDPEAMAGRGLYNRGHFSKDMYARLYLHRVLPGLERVVYTDTDFVVSGDLAQVFNAPLGKYPIGIVVRDRGQAKIEMLKHHDYVKETEFGKYANLYEYLTGYLKFTEEDCDTYFSSCLIVFNLKAAGKILDEGMPALMGNKYLFPDQDILNILFKNNKFVLERRFNTMPWEVLDYVSEHGKLPDVIHFAGPVKPNRTIGSMGDIEYWRYVSGTDFYYQALEAFIDNKLAALRSEIEGLARKKKKRSKKRGKSPKKKK